MTFPSICDGLTGDPVPCGEVVNGGKPHGEGFTDRYDLLLREFGRGVGGGSDPTVPDAIHQVLGLGSDEEMVGVTADRVMALVPDNEIGVSFTVEETVRKAVGEHLFPSPFKLSVPLGFCSLPFPAAARLDLNPLHKAVVVHKGGLQDASVDDR